MLKLFVFSTLLLLSFTLIPTGAQIPRVCVQNATQVNATCCPPDPNNPAAGPCGGTTRGSCGQIKVNINGTRTTPTGPLTDVDDIRVDWPIHLFQNACQCSYFYSGYACQHALGGGAGKGWHIFVPWLKKNITRMRKNALDLTPDEKQRFVDVLSQSKEEISDYVILNDIKVTGSGKNEVSYFNVSVYDFYVFLNYFATNGVDFFRETDSTDDEETVLVKDGMEWPDFAHKNPNFIHFHRTLLSRFEQDLDTLSKKLSPAGVTTTPFALPYWDWSNKTKCEVCDDTLVGALNASDPDNRLSSGSPFASWRVLCQGSSMSQHPCDPEADRPLISRAYSTNPLYQSLPSSDEVNFALNATQYDSAPYNETSDSTSFRNLLEGFVGQDNNKTAVAMGKLYIGMQVRNYLNGTWTDLALGPNDPLFWLHQAYLDRLYDTWLQKNSESPGLDIPENATVPKGTSQQDNLVGFFPIEPAYKRKFSSSFLGYSYVETTEQPIALSAVDDESSQYKDYSAATVLWSTAGCLALLFCVGFFIYYKRRKSYYRYVESISFEEIDCNEKTHLLSQDSKQPM